MTSATQARIGWSGAALAVSVLIICGPAAGQSYWAKRAGEVASARLADQKADREQAAQTEGERNAHPAYEAPSFQLASSPETAPADTVRQTTGETTTVTTIERGPLPGFFQTVGRDLREAPGLLWHDTKATYGNPWNLVFLLGAGGTSIALRPEADDDIQDFYDHHHTFPQGERDAIDAVSNPATAFAVAGLMYTAGQTLQDCKTYEVGKRAFSALIITDASTVLLKLAANTESPNGQNFSWPSGHVSSTMALATVLNDAYGPLVGVPMFGLTALSGIQRLDNREHHFSDVIFGAALGWVVGETVMKEHRPQVFGGDIAPYCDPANGNAGVAWIKPLGN